METSETAALTEALRANRRTCALLERQIRELEVLCRQDVLPDGGEYPTWYGAVGTDGKAGFRVGDDSQSGYTSWLDDNRQFQGRVVIDSDAPFVWTGILATTRYDLRQTDEYGTTRETVSYKSLQNAPSNSVYGSPTERSQYPDIRLGFVDAGSGRELFQAQQDDKVGALLSPELFNTFRIFERDSALSGVDAPGHGPNQAFALPAKTVLAANDVVLINAQASFFNFAPEGSLFPLRVYVTLLGYKIFGD